MDGNKYLIFSKYSYCLNSYIFAFGIIFLNIQLVHSADCTGPKVYSCKTSRSDILVKYPVLPNKKMECTVREILNQDIATLKEDTGYDENDPDSESISYEEHFHLTKPNSKLSRRQLN